MTRAAVIRRVAVVAALAAFAACKKTTEPAVPQSVTISPASLSFSSKGATRQLAATVKDQNGGTIQGASVTWSTGNPAVATVTSGGLAASVGNGTTQITAHAGAVSGSATVTVAQSAFFVTKVGGDNQSGTVGAQLAQALAAQVTDSLGNPVSGVTVTFAVTSGGGSLTSTSVLTDGSGNATTLWTIGTSTSTLQRVSASSGAATAAVFSATPTAGPPKTVVKQAGDNQKVGVSTAAPIKPAVLVTDQFGNTVSGATVTFTAGASGGSVTGGTVQTNASGVGTVGGWTASASPGTDTLFATVTGAGITGNPAVFLMTAATPGAPASVVVQAGDGQTGLEGFALNFAPAVLVRDTANIPVSGATVTFAAATGGGSVTGGVVLTGSDGVATVGSWVMGGSPGANTMTATVTGGGITGNPVTFSATSAAPLYNIEVRYLGTAPTGTRKAAFDSAAAFWMRAIYGDVPSVLMQISAGQCGTNSPAMNETVDDIVIFVTLDSIDGKGKILGQAGPCYVRSTGSPTTCAPDCRSIVGIMHFDTADVVTLENNGQWVEVIRHEMAHVIGFGSLWGSNALGLLVGPASQGGADPHFIGAQGLATFDRIGGTSYTGGAKVPVANVGGAGTLDSHWREATFGNELMTGFIDPGTNPLSVLSIAAMGDENYTVNYAAAQAYSHTFSAPPFSTAAAVEMQDDLVHLPIFMVNRQGRVVGVMHR
jgi:leishmanolysin/Big-like domain-containing protein